MTNAEMIKVAVAHGFDAFQDDASDGICVMIPWTNFNTNEEGEDQYICHNTDDLRAALGY